MISMDNLDHALIDEYLHMNQKIKRVEQALCKAKQTFDNQSFIGSSLAYADDGITPIRPPRIEEAVITFVDLEQLYSQAINILQFKQRYFSQFVNSLRQDERFSVINNHMGHDLQIRMLNEIRQIEEATSHCFGMYVEEAIEQPINKTDVLYVMEQVLGMSI